MVAHADLVAADGLHTPVYGPTATDPADTLTIREGAWWEDSSTTPHAIKRRASGAWVVIYGPAKVPDHAHTAANGPGGTLSGYVLESLLDAKGDLIAASADNTPAKVTVGANGLVPMADSTQAAGLKYAQPGLGTMVGAHVYHNAAQSLADNTDTALAFNSERLDSDAFHDTVTNNPRLTVPTGKGGNYMIGAVVQFASNATGFRSIFLRKNGTTGLAFTRTPAVSGVVTVIALSTPGPVALAAGDYVEVLVKQNSGGALNADTAGDYSPEFGMVLVGT